MCEEFYDKYIGKINSIKTDWTISDFTKGEILGEGKWGKVYSVIENKTGLNYALKQIVIFDKSDVNMNEVLNNIIVSGHPNICSIIGTFTYHDENDGIKQDHCTIVIIQEMCGKDLLLFELNEISTVQKVKWMIQLLNAVEYCHNLGILHLDIKIENCVIDKDNNLKLIDFGYSQNESSINHILCGTPHYISPEIAIAYTSKKPYISKAADVWACGAFFVYLFQDEIYYKKPNLGYSPREVINQIIKHHIVEEDLFNVPEIFNPLILEMLEYDYKKRITISEALEQFKEIYDNI